jgi:hypothetical protein
MANLPQLKIGVQLRCIAVHHENEAKSHDFASFPFIFEGVAPNRPNCILLK